MNDILITTTSILQGYEVKKYLGLVTARLTIGTDVFSDFFASLTDVFGGNSKTYDKELNKLNDRCIDLIKAETKKINGNAVIGIKIDYDEITGKNKQMFLISITGTAAIIKSNIESLMNDIIDEFSAMGQVKDLKIRELKINRLLNDSNNLFIDKRSLFGYYRICGYYSKAEDILYEMLAGVDEFDIKKYKAILQEGVKFYENLLEETDGSLDKGNLPRNEVQDGLREIKKKLV